MSNALIVKPLPILAAVAGSTAAGDPIYVGNDHMGVIWKSATGSTQQAIRVDMGADVAFDTILLLGCTGASNASELLVEAATEAQGASIPPGSYSAPLVPFFAGSVVPVSGRSRALWLAPVAAPAVARHFRFTVTGLSSAALSVARIVIGKRVQLQRNFSFGAAFGVRDLGNADFSTRGVFLRRRGVKLRSVGLTFSSVYKDEVEGVVHPLIEQVGLTEPVALITDADADAQRQNRIWFGPLVGDLGTIWARPNGFEWRANLVALNA